MAQRKSVRQIAVVGQSHLPLIVIDKQRLNVSLAVGAGGTVADVADSNISFAQYPELFRREHLGHQACIPAGGKDTVIVDRDPRALLPSVLQGIEGIIAKGGQIRTLRGENPEHTAFFMNPGHLSIPRCGAAFPDTRPLHRRDPGENGPCPASHRSCCPKIGRYPG